MRKAALLLAVCLAGIPVHAQQDANQSSDHPMLSRMPGYYIEEYDSQDFATFELEVDPPRSVEGRYWKISYGLKEGEKKSGPVQIARNYTDLFARRGGRTLLDDVDAGGGTTVAQLPVKGKNIWLQLSVSNGGEVYDVVVVEEAAMEQKVEFTATELARTLHDKGSVALHGILFDTNRSSIRPESAAVLATIGDVLRADPALTLEVQGHTDNVGAAEANLKLSRERASAVKAYLVETFAVAPDRLTTTGFGQTRPVADNSSESGRGLNRRVELMKR